MKPIKYWKNLSLVDIIIEIDGEIVTEQWRDIFGFEGKYKCSTMGRFKSLSRIVPHGKCGTKSYPTRILRQHKTRQGYLRMELHKNGIGESKPSHVWIAETWIENTYNKPTVNHDNGIKWNNVISNLEWATSKEQDEHARRTGLKVALRGEQCSFTKLKDSDVLDIFNSTIRNRDLAIKYEVEESVICAIKKGRSRAYLTGKEYINSRLTEEKIIEIFNNELPLRKAAKLLGVSAGSVHMIRSGRRYAHITGKVQDAMAGT